MDVAVCGRRIVNLMAGYEGRYWVAGGWALDMFAGATSRDHSDVDILTPLEDVNSLIRLFGPARIRLQDARTGEVAELDDGSLLEPGRTIVLVADVDEEVQFLLARIERDEWIFPRGTGRIRRSLDKVTRRESTSGCVYQSPEVVLLHKSRSPREKDGRDFKRALPRLTVEQAQWLFHGVYGPYPDHVWLPGLHAHLGQG